MTTAVGAGSDVQAVYTYGWDTAFVLPVTTVNRAIVDHGSSPRTLTHTDPGYTLTARFGDWQIGPGGDGKAVRMIWPLHDLVLTYPSTGKQLHFDGHAVVEVGLHYVPHTGASATGAAAGSHTTPMALTVDPTGPSPTTPPLSVVAAVLTPQPGTVSTALISAGLLAWGSAHLGEFAHVFAVVDLDTRIDTGPWSFVKPNYTDYAYLDGATPETGLFGVLCTTGNRTGETLAEQISPAAIPTGSGAGFLLSPTRLLDDLVRPAMKLAYPGLTDGNFRLNTDGSELYLVDGTSVQLADVQAEGGTYHPVLTNLTVATDGTTLQLNSYTSTEVAPGITATCRSTHWYTITLGTAAAGSTLTFSQTQDPSIVHDIHQSEGSVLTEIIIGIVATVALILLTVLTAGAALLVGGLVIGLLLGATMLVPALIEKLDHDDAPSIDLLLVNAVAPIVWTGSAEFRLDRVALNQSLQLGGDPRFAVRA